MKVIESFIDAKEFAGHFVAYETTSSYFAVEDDGCYKLENQALNFGYVSRDSNYSYSKPSGNRLLVVIKPNSVDRLRALVIDKLTQKPPTDSPLLAMRLATADELISLLTAISNDQAVISTLLFKESMKGLVSGNWVL